jgi:hypothetical protein
MLASGGLLASCSSSAAPAHPSACGAVAAVLSDGPDPGADPVGYAEAQVKPLRQLHIGNASLADAVRHLAGAYETFFQRGGKGATGHAVAVAQDTVNRICPGAAE